MTEILLVRHGQAAFGTDDYDRLTTLGWEQASLLGQYFAARTVNFDAVATGTLRRHRETLAGVQEHLPPLPGARELPGLNEYDFVDLVGAWRRVQTEPIPDPASPRDFYRLLKKALLQWSRGELPDAAEQWDHFEQRVRATLDQLAPEGAERVLVVTSGGPVSALLREVLALSVANMINLNLQAANTGITRLISKHGKHRLSSFNGLPHLDHPDTLHLISFT